MSEGREPRQQAGLAGIVTLIVLALAAVFSEKEIFATVRECLQVIAPNFATQPIATLAFFALLLLFIIAIFWIGKYYEHKPSGKYAAPKRPNSASSIQRRNKKRRKK